MKTKLERLTLKKFSTSIIKNTQKILGGLASDISDGGSSCDTGSGSSGNWEWDSDIETFDANGNRDGRDMAGARRLREATSSNNVAY